MSGLNATQSNAGHCRGLCRLPPPRHHFRPGSRRPPAAPLCTWRGQRAQRLRAGKPRAPGCVDGLPSRAPVTGSDEAVTNARRAVGGPLSVFTEISPTTFTGIATGQYRKRVRGEPAHAPRPSGLSEFRGSGRLQARPDRCAGVRVTRVPPGHRHPARVPAVPPPAGRGHSVAGLLLAGCRVQHWTRARERRRT